MLAAAAPLDSRVTCTGCGPGEHVEQHHPPLFRARRRRLLARMSEARGRHIGLRLVVVLSGTTAFGYIHVMSEYFTMNSFSVASWDTPPGFGSSLPPPSRSPPS